MPKHARSFQDTQSAPSSI